MLNWGKSWCVLRVSSKIRSEPQSLTHCPLQAEMNLTGARSVQGADLKGCFPSFPLSICKCDKVWPNNSKNVFFHSLFYVDPHKFLDTGDFLISYHLLCLLAIASDTFLSDPLQPQSRQLYGFFLISSLVPYSKWLQVNTVQSLHVWALQRESPEEWWPCGDYFKYVERGLFLWLMSPTTSAPWVHCFACRALTQGTEEP